MSTALFDLSGKVALVTGATHGIGMAIATGFAPGGRGSALTTSRTRSSMGPRFREAGRLAPRPMIGFRSGALPPPEIFLLGGPGPCLDPLDIKNDGNFRAAQAS